MMHSPAFHRHPQEAAIIGRLLVGYGELELEMTSCVGKVIGGKDSAIRILYRVRNESTRLDIADALMKRKYVEMGHGGAYAAALGAMRCARNIRNILAHAQWGDEPTGNLWFTDLQAVAHSDSGPPYEWRELPPSVLIECDDFFGYTRECWLHLEGATDWMGNPVVSTSRAFPKPTQRNPVNLQSLPGTRTPPWQP